MRRLSNSTVEEKQAVVSFEESGLALNLNLCQSVGGARSRIYSGPQLGVCLSGPSRAEAGSARSSLTRKAVMCTAVDDASFLSVRGRQ